jgi:EAL domain-containing protein (putative c-di-GMP-specific phosphodiesterase class I)
MLVELPVNGIKFDRSFGKKMLEKLKHFEVVRTTIDLAHRLGKFVIAERIETEGQVNQLRALNGEVGQGFLFSKALPLESLRSMQAYFRKKRHLSYPVPVSGCLGSYPFPAEIDSSPHRRPR